MTRERSLIRRVQEAAAEVADAVAAAEYWYRLRVEEIERDLDRQLRDARDATEEKLTEIRRNYEDALGRVQQELRRVERGAGLWAAPWEDDGWSRYTPPAGPPAAVRIGMLILKGRYSQIETPALLPFVGGGNLVIEVSGAAKAAASQAVQSVVLRLLATVPPSKLRMLLIDPVGLGQNVAAFMHLADFLEELVTSRAWTDPSHIEKHLADLSAHMEMVIQKYLRNRYRTMEQYNDEAGEVAEPYRLVVAINFPVNFNEQAARRLVSIATNGPRCGVYTIATVDTEQPPPYGFNLADLERAATVVAWDGRRFVWQDPDFQAAELRLDIPPPPQRSEDLIRAIGAAAVEASKVELPFTSVVPPPPTWWQANTVDGICVPIGRAGARKALNFTLGQGTAVHALIAGRTGSGKSSLLHTLILSLAVTYPPEELELYLVDFKKGVEFKDYAPSSGAAQPLPHARVIAIESEREFGLSCLEGLDAELERRGTLFRNAACSTFKEYREKTGARLPRILLLVDEFHELFTEDDAIAQKAALLLDRLARQGRAFGVHLVLGSQTLAGSHTLPRSTIDQMAVRIALQCSEADSRLILADGNPAARLLSRPGEAIYNTSSGLEEGNILFQIAWLSNEQKNQLLTELGAQIRAPELLSRRPIVFEGDAPAKLEENQQLEILLSSSRWPGPARVTRAWLGNPVALRPPVAAPFVRQKGRHLLIVGHDENLAVGMLAAAVMSIASQLGPEQAMFYLADFSTADSLWRDLAQGLAAALPHPSRVVARGDLSAAIEDLAEVLLRRSEHANGEEPSIFLVAMGLHRARELREDESEFAGWGAEEGGSVSPAKRFAVILKDGPEVGVHVLGWWDAYTSVTRAVGRRNLGECGMRVCMAMSGEDSSHLLDVPAAAKLGRHRALFWDDQEVGHLEKFIPYAVPSPEWLASFGERLRRRMA